MAEILEPHEWNKRLLKEQLARGEEPNIPEPNLPNLWETTTEPPKVKDFDPSKNSAVKVAKPGRAKAIQPGGDAMVGSLDAD